MVDISNVEIMILLGAFELAVIEGILCFRLNRRKFFFLSTLLCGALVLGYTFLLPIDKFGAWIQVPIILIMLLHIYLGHEIPLLQALFLGIAGYTVQHIASLLDSILALLAPEYLSHMGTDISVSFWGYASILLCCATTYVAAYFILVKPMQRMRTLKRKATLPVVTLAGVMLIMNQLWGVTFGFYGSEFEYSFMSLSQYIWNLVCCVLCLGLQFGIFSMNDMELELEIIRRLSAEREKQYLMSKNTVDAINRKCHNLKYELSALTTAEDNQKHIREAMALVDSFDSAIRTGNEALDVIFSEKSVYCQQEQITFVCMIDGKQLDFMDVTDQYVLFGNLIDNAVNAVQKLDEPTQRVIYVNVQAQNKFLLIHTENPYTGDMRFRDGLPMTTSDDEENHGFGMGSIRMICEKYGGSLNARSDAGTFYLNLLIPLQL